MKDKNNWLNCTPDRFTKSCRIMILCALLVSLPLIYMLVYYTGGIKYGYSHAVYISILIAGIVFGTKSGLIMGIAAGILFGPWMPIDVVTGETQLLTNWLFRLVIFTSVGTISGYTSSRLRSRTIKIDNLMSTHPETKIKNTNYLLKLDQHLSPSKQTIVTVLINNYNNIVDILGFDVYYHLVRQIHDDIIAAFPSKSLVIQADSNKLWIIKEFKNLKEDAEKIVEIMSTPKIIDSIPLYVDYSVGASYVDRGEECKDLSSFRASDESARYAQVNKLSYIVYNDITMKKRNEYELLATFENALANDETYLVYQPALDINTMKLIGLEALIRWKHPVRGIIVPDAFIPLVEETRLIHLLTDWVIKKALNKLKQLLDQGITLRMAINVSAKNLYDPNFCNRVAKALEDSNVPVHLVEMEITESALMVEPEESKKTLNKLVEKGISIALDDFGRGYSSFTYLSQFPITTIKIDQSFIREITTSPIARQIIKSTIDLSVKIGNQVIAEGVETIEELDELKELGCEYAQGYYFARPMNEEDLTEWLNKQSFEKAA